MTVARAGHPEFLVVTLQSRLERLVDAGRGGGDARSLGVKIRELSGLFGENRARRRADYMADPGLRRAYLAFFLPQYAAKIALLLERLRREGSLELPERPRVLDVGAGPLTGLFGAWLAQGALGASVALDLAWRAMEAGREIFAAVAPHQSIALVEQSVQRRPLPAGPFDLIIVAHVLNELGDPRRGLEIRASLLRTLLELLSPQGRLVVVEPGTRVHGRALQAVRDELVNGGAVVLSPCRGARSCPLLKTSGDWCHGETAWERPAAFIELEKASGLRKTELKESHLVLARPGDAASPRSGLRLIGGLMTDRAGVERRYGCGSRGIEVLVGRPLLPREAREPLRHGLLDPVTADIETDGDRPARGRTLATPSSVRGGQGGPRGAGEPARSGRGRGGRRRR